MNGRKLTMAFAEMVDKKESGMNEFDKMLSCHKKRREQREIKSDYEVAKKVKKIVIDEGGDIPIWVWYMKVRSIHTMKNLVLYCFDK